MQAKVVKKLKLPKQLGIFTSRCIGKVIKAVIFTLPAISIICLADIVYQATRTGPPLEAEMIGKDVEH